jgi:hypothetical protein
MTRTHRFFGAAFAVAVLLSVAGCSKVSRTAAVQFNDALVEAGNRVAVSGLAFGEAAGKAIGGGIQEVAKAKRELENVTEALARAKSDMKLIKVPDSPTARKFFEEHQKLLKLQEQIVKEDFGAIVKVLDDQLLTPQERSRKLMPIANYLRSLDQTMLTDLVAAQAAFARETGFQVKK